MFAVVFGLNLAVAGSRDRRRICAMSLAGVFAPVPTPFDERDQPDTRR
jgi:hypothetical protein